MNNCRECNRRLVGKYSKQKGICSPCSMSIKEVIRNDPTGKITRIKRMLALFDKNNTSLSISQLCIFWNLQGEIHLTEKSIFRYCEEAISNGWLEKQKKTNSNKNYYILTIEGKNNKITR